MKKLRKEAKKLVKKIMKDKKCVISSDLCRCMDETDPLDEKFFVLHYDVVSQHRSRFLTAVRNEIRKELEEEHTLLEYFNLISIADLMDVRLPGKKSKNLKIAQILWEDFNAEDNLKSRKTIIKLQNLLKAE